MCKNAEPRVVAARTETTMKQQIEDRLQALRAEYDSGETMLATMEAKQADIRRTLLRISGAIQVLEELLHDIPETVDPAARAEEGLMREETGPVKGSDSDDRRSNAGDAVTVAAMAV